MNFIYRILNSRLSPWVLLLILAVAFYVTVKSSQAKSREIDRLSNNQESLLTDLQKVKNSFGKEVAKVQALELSKNEFEKLFQEQVEIAKSLRLKIKRLESFTTTAVETKDTIIVDVQNPIAIDSLPIVRPFRYSDGWVDLKGDITIQGKMSVDPAHINITYAVKDTLDVILYRVPKRFLFIKYGIKRIDCYIDPRNPNSLVTMGSCVVLKRRR